MANQVPPPTQEPIADENGSITDTWNRWLIDLSQAIVKAPINVRAPNGLTAQGASIGTTSLVPTLTAAGMYRLSYYARVTIPGSVSSSLTVALSWTDHGVTQTFTGAAMVTNTTTTWQDRTLFVYIDANLPVTYSTVYADGGGATAMKYELYVGIEQVAI